MPMQPGVRLGAFEILAPIGAGGMGEVYRARDTRLDRTVAIKVLPAALAADPQLRERFDREARAISSLSHPHICSLHDVGHQDGTDFLVLEYLEGETLEARLKAAALAGSSGTRPRALPVAEAIAIGSQILAALDAAHRAGIVHRDLKPANVMLTRTGAKLLDFGLAKAAAPAIAATGLSMAPTTPPNLTGQGTILGTFQYMAPEQLEGLEADARTDIFAFGSVLFEMLTGRPPFEGRTRAQLLGAILKDDPPPVSTIQPLAPKALDRIVATCLEKEPDDRWQSATDLRRELLWTADQGSNAQDERLSAQRARATGLHRVTAWKLAAGVLATALVATLFGVRYFRESDETSDTFQFTIAPPDKAAFGGPAGGGTGAATQLAVSPDGRSIVFVARTATRYSLWLRTLASVSVRELPGTEDAAFPFWSPDSRYVAFFAGGKLKKVQLAGGPPVILCDAVQSWGGAWNRDNVIVFGSLRSPLVRVSSAGGTPSPATRLDSGYGETSHRWPHFLPDGRHFLFTAVTGPNAIAPKPSQIKIGSLDSTDIVTLFAAESAAQFGSGHLLFVRDGSLMAQPFDTKALRVSGDPFPIGEEISTEGSRYVGFSVSRQGTLVYAHGGGLSSSALRWFDRSGKSLGQVGGGGAYQNLALSPDERRVAASIATGSPANGDIWIIDLERNGASRLTFEPSYEAYPVWSPDSRRIAFASAGPSGNSIHVRAASGINDDIVLVKSAGSTRTATFTIPTDWSPDGQFIVYQVPSNGSTGTDVAAVTVGGDGKQLPVVTRNGADTMAVFSPDGRWLAYVGDDGGTRQVYVQSFPTAASQYQISTDGGTQPLWRGDGKELFFLALDGMMMAVPVVTAARFEAGAPTPLFPSGTYSIGNNRQYAVTKDGTRFLILVPRSSDRNATTQPLTLVLNWPKSIQK